MYKILTCVFLALPVAAFSQQKISLTQAPASPEVLAKDIISTGFGERDFALSPNGTEIFYTLQSPQGIFQTILYRKKNTNGEWSKAEVASFAGNYSDLEPAFSPDGNKLYFSSNRPLQGTAVKDFDIWMVEKENGKWGKPTNLGTPINTTEDEFYPSITKTGNLYFTAAYKNGIGKEDIFMASWQNGKYGEPVPLDTAVNSKTYEFNAFVSPDEDYIIFTSYGRKDDKGRGDLYMSVKDASGKWQAAKNMAMLNSNKIDYCPFVSFDKKLLFFTSERINIEQSYSKPARLDELLKTFSSPQNGGGDIYWVSFEKIMAELKN
ncbi:MAG: hypothetical protein WBP16_06380 [Ferruginibacter sp.]